MIRYARLPEFAADPKTLQIETQALLEGWQNHYNLKNYTGSWTALPLRSPGGAADDIYADSLQGNIFADTVYMSNCPSIRQIVDRLQAEVKSVRLLNLVSGGVIKEHRDSELAFEYGEARFHFPIFTNNQVEFKVDGRAVVMNEGECWYINANRKHKVANYGSTDRVHLVIDVIVNDWLKNRMADAEIEYVTPLEQMEGWDVIIRHLRTSDDPDMLRHAEEMECQLIAARAEASAAI